MKFFALSCLLSNLLSDAERHLFIRSYFVCLRRSHPPLTPLPSCSLSFSLPPDEVLKATPPPLHLHTHTSTPHPHRLGFIWALVGEWIDGSGTGGVSWVLEVLILASNGK